MLIFLKRLVKFNLIPFVVLTAVAGYWLSFRIEYSFEWTHFLGLIFGVTLISAGSFALNQVQEYQLDRLMHRTQARPIATGELSPQQGLIVSLSLMSCGSLVLFWIQPLSALLGLLTIFSYNGLYTMIWKPRWIFAAIPGAIPGAMPVVIGYSANSTQIFTRECVYAFLVMFMWQMPHFWALALKYKEDYRRGNVPTLPVAMDDSRTLYFIGIYMLVYVALAVISPWIIDSSWLYLLVVIPFSIKVLFEFVRFFRSKGKTGWLSFFLWTNFSMLAFLFVPILDRWLEIFLEMRNL
ncbi:MAG: protoheme IX farnesyltransferase [Bdellovibrionales bacterium]|nr:protoheme IX farnesyltransferase [Bdellovibrionales bacterium]